MSVYPQDMENVRKNLLHLMQTRKLSANRLADMAGMSQTTLSRFLAGRNKEIRAENLEKIASALGVTVESIRKGSDGELSDNRQILSNEELSMLLSFRVLPPSKQREVSEMIKNEEEKILEVLRHHNIKKL